LPELGYDFIVPSALATSGPHDVEEVSMTTAKHPGDDTNLELELFTAWKVEHPDGTRQEFDDELRSLTNDARPNLAAGHVPRSWDDDPVIIKRRMFEEWRAIRPDGTHAQFEAEWSAVTQAT
jgi:hypothetical protein